MKNKLKEEMLKEIFIQTGGRPENIKIAEVCAEIAVKAISSNTMLAVSLPSDEDIEKKFIAKGLIVTKDGQFSEPATMEMYYNYLRQEGAKWMRGIIEARQ